ncbi:type II secretion system F family protein [Ferrimonas balearica]|uniref:type II secretion system F family protein n=1 Tax=Ferrimonas balearica TaxID=44012 RepID=UPI001C997DFB|nr:type II secretion system F family protein [Ferrimonas balearica]MBY5992136.1 type II secretion system F family protein [Ferrimonas balearica]
MALATKAYRQAEAKHSAQGKSPLDVQTFLWTGKNSKGKPLKGELRGQSSAEIKVLLRKQGVTPLSVKKKPKALFERKKKVKAMDIAVVTRQIATMLTAGVPLVTALEMVGRGHENEAVRKLLGSILGEVQSGIPLSKALRPHRTHFDDLYCDLVAAGEHSGTLDTVYDRIATYREKAEALKSKIKKAMFYPAAVIVVAVVVTVILLLFVVPQFEAIFNDFGAELPAFTQMIIGLSQFLSSSWYYFLGMLSVAAWMFIRSHRNSQKFRDEFDKALLKLPAVGPILHKASIARFARTLATTFAAGVPLVEGLDSSAGASGNALYRDAILKVKEEVISGLQMNIAMRTTGLFPDMLTQMVMIGEESGSLDDMLNKVANIYEMQVDDAVDGLSTLIEPMLMVVIGTIVGGLVVAMYLPIFQLGNVVG